MLPVGLELLFELRLLGDVLASIGNTNPLVEVEPHVTPLNRVGLDGGDGDALVKVLGIEVRALLVLFIEYGALLGNDKGGVVLPPLPHPHAHDAQHTISAWMWMFRGFSLGSLGVSVKVVLKSIVMILRQAPWDVSVTEGRTLHSKFGRDEGAISVPFL